MTLIDNNGNILSPLLVAPVNTHDSILLPQALKQTCSFLTQELRLSLKDVPVTLDKGFFSHENMTAIRAQNMKPVIHPNRRNTKEPVKIARMYRWFNRAIYKQRFAIERTFAWQDTYRKTVIVYERLSATRLGCKHLAYAMINLRTFVGNSE